ncbi:hypothetical protein B7494_g1742 [Chlorociboria aeruginascens]|nr:hypothetical protein B7494_g1742 [Chlorociboria aeruginascens]
MEDSYPNYSRYDDAIVIRDPQTRQLILRGTSPSLTATNCPTCHRPFRSASPTRDASPSRSSSAFINPEYFRMLQAANGSTDHNPPSSPIRRLVQPAFGSPASPSSVGDAEFIASVPAGDTGHKIKKEAFSPNYFARFFTEETELGRGGKGVVLLVRHELDGVSLGQFACKRVPVGNDHDWLEKVLIEVQLLQGLSHPNLVSYRHVWLEDVKLNRFSPSVPCAFILQQYCNSGDLLHYIVGSGPVSTTKEQMKEQMRRRSRGQSDRSGDIRPSQRKLGFDEIYSFFKDITSGLAHLHASNYIHRDLKPSNCLLHKDGNEMRCLISDFGEVQAENIVRKSTGSTGTISYCAPEVLKLNSSGKYGNFTTKSDIFSLGMILYFMCFGRLPYKSADSIEEDFEDMDLLRAEISTWEGFHDERKERPELPNQLYNFLKRLLALDPADRPSANDILTAIQTETGLENPTRSRNGNAPGLGRRIQSLDSTPGTPANGNLASSNKVTILTNQEPRRVRSAAYLEDAPSDSSPESTPPSQLTLETKRVLPQQPQAHPSPPLLMPPPSTALSSIKNRISLYHHYTLSWYHLNESLLNILTKLLIFLFKILSLTQLCFPSAPKQEIFYPLIGIAALELGIGQRIQWRVTLPLVILHTSVILGMTTWGGMMCQRRNDGNWGAIGGEDWKDDLL